MEVEIITTSSYSEELIKTFTSYSGCDIVATINMKVNGTLHHYVVGQIQTLTYSVYQDKHPVRNLGNQNPVDYVHGNRTIAGTMIFTTLNKDVAIDLIQAYKEEYRDKHVLMDDLPPFDITLSYANEFGHKSSQIIYGVRIISEGKTMSVNDIYTETSYQYVATAIEHMTDLPYVSIKKDGDGDDENGSGSGSIVDRPEHNPSNVKVYTQVRETFVDKHGVQRSHVDIWLTTGVKNSMFTIKNEQKDDVYHGSVNNKITVNLAKGKYTIYVSGTHQDNSFSIQSLIVC